MVDKVNQYGEIEEAKGLRGRSAAGAERDYFKMKETRPRRNARRAGAVGPDSLEQRMAGVSGSNLERIIFKRLETIWGPANIAFIYKYQLGSVSGVKDARAFIGGIEADFIILSRPSGRKLVLEPQGAHWHGPTDAPADLERQLFFMSVGMDFAEIWEYEVMLGDPYLDRRLLQLIGSSGRVSLDQETEREIRRHERLLGEGIQRWSGSESNISTT